MSESGTFEQLADVLSGARPVPKPAKRRREIDRSRDHAVYAAPHRPIRRHAHSRPEDVVTARVQRPRPVAEPPRSPSRIGIPVTLIAFLVTFAFGLAVMALVR